MLAHWDPAKNMLGKRLSLSELQVEQIRIRDAKTVGGFGQTLPNVEDSSSVDPQRLGFVVCVSVNRGLKSTSSRMGLATVV